VVAHSSLRSGVCIMHVSTVSTALHHLAILVHAFSRRWPKLKIVPPSTPPNDMPDRTLFSTSKGLPAPVEDVHFNSMYQSENLKGEFEWLQLGFLQLQCHLLSSLEVAER